MLIALMRSFHEIYINYLYIIGGVLSILKIGTLLSIAALNFKQTMDAVMVLIKC